MLFIPIIDYFLVIILITIKEVLDAKIFSDRSIYKLIALIYPSYLFKTYY